MNRDPDLGYYGRNLWLPKKHVNVRSVKAGLEFPVMGEKGIEYLQLWTDRSTHLVVPREFIRRTMYPSLPFKIVPVLPASYRQVKFKENITLDIKDPTQDIQKNAFKAYMAADCGILNLACVSGSALIDLNRAGKGFSINLRDAYERFNGLAAKHNWDQTIPTFVRSNKGKQVGLQRVAAMLYKGKRRTYTLRLRNGMTLRATGDHEIQVEENKYVPLRELAPGDSVLIDSDRTESIRKPKEAYRRLSWYPSHPFVRVQKRTRPSGKIDLCCQIEEHRIVAECALNKIGSIKGYRALFKTGKIAGLQFIDPALFHVHHIDENKRNNSPDNLEILPAEEHRAHHSMGAEAFGYGIPTAREIESITPFGMEDVYDIVCDDPHHNFTANKIIVHNCGRGKTALTLKRIAARGVPALVIMNNTTLIGQWGKSIEQFLEVEGGVGIVQGPPDTWDWHDRGIVLASLMSVAIRYQELPVGFSSYFGDIYYDEVHHLSAEVFSRAAPMFYGKRYGLTATPKREDGLELVYQYNIGPVFHRYLIQDLTPKIFFHLNPVKLNMLSADVKFAISDKNGKPCLPKLRSYLGTMPENNRYIAKETKRALAKGRKILALSHSVDQLVTLHKMFRGSGLCIGDVKDINLRLKALRECQLTFGTLDLVREGLDEDTLDTIFFLTPFGSKDIVDGGKNTFQQGMGRALRPRKDKRQPVITVFDYLYIPKLHQQCNKMKQLLKEWPVDEGGPFEFEVIKAYEEIK
jgi:superfamily II DNA or RNA helicase